MLALGSSLQVTPAALLPPLAKQSGARVVIINRDETALDDLADAVLRGSLADTLAQIDEQLSS